MKRNFFYSLLLLSGFCWSCGEEPLGQPSTDGIAPGVLTDVQVENISGGVVFTYGLPKDEDLLYVMAQYSQRGEKRDVKASVYTNTLKIEGFGDTVSYPVSLVCVDRSGNVSLPVEVTVKPLIPPVQMILKSVSIIPDFGGVKLNWKNERRADVSIYLMAQDSAGMLSERDVLYTSVAAGEYSLRGFDTIPRNFGIYVRDRWGNYSDTLVVEQKPLYEVELDQSKFKRQTIPCDNTTSVSLGFSFEGLWDGNTGDWNGMHTDDANGGKRPCYFTIDLGQVVVLSRLKLWHRPGEYYYSHYNPKQWDVFGCLNPKSSELSESYWGKGGEWESDWTKLQSCEIIKPSGDFDEVTNEDKDFASKGFEFNFPVPGTPVRYVRFVINKTWSGGTDVHISEIRFWGQPVKTEE